MACDRDDPHFLTSGIVRRKVLLGMVICRALGIVRRAELLGDCGCMPSGKGRVKVRGGDFFCGVVVGNEGCLAER